MYLALCRALSAAASLLYEPLKRRISAMDMRHSIQPEISTYLLQAPQIGKNEAYIECISIIGTKFHFNLKLLPLFFKQLDIWLFIVSVTVLLTVLDPTDAVAVAGYWVLAAIWLSIVVLYVGFITLTLTGLYLVLKNTPIRTVILPFVSFAVLSALLFMGPSIEMLFLGDLGEATTVIPFHEILLCLIVEQAFLTLYVSLGASRIMARQAQVNASPVAEAPIPQISSTEGSTPHRKDRVIKVGKLSLNVADICAISADEHYVRIQTLSQEELIRERFTQVISDLPPSLGFQIHRSHWVAFSAVEEVVRTDGHHSAILKSGAKLPISKARQRDFKECLMVFEARLNQPVLA
jgi:hypothetical protein